MIKSAGHDYAVDEPLELRSVPVVDSSEYVARILCTGCGRDFDVLRSDKTAYAPVVPAHAHGTAEVGGGTLPGCRSLSVVPFEPEPPRRAAARSAARRSPFQTVPGRASATDCSCPGTSSTTMSAGDACADSTSAAAAYGRGARTSAEFWRSVDESPHLSLT